MIPFNRADIVGKELAYIEQAVRSGVISGEGEFGRRAELQIERLLGSTNSKVLLTPSCTDALEMCALLLNTVAGSEVILPSFTFVSTATAFIRNGATPVFADLDPETLNISFEEIDSLVSPATRAVAVVHYAGFPCDLDRIVPALREKGISLVEDAAHALGTKHRNKSLGTFGELGTFSFHETKNVTCGEGGALVVNSPAMLDQAHIVRDKGTNRRAFQRGDAAFYTLVEVGSSFVMSDVLAAFLCAQLEQLEQLNARRRAIFELYRQGLLPLRDKGLLTFPDREDLQNSSAHLFFILLADDTERESLRKYLIERGIGAVFHYQPLHLSPYVVRRWGEQRPLPVTERVSKQLLRLPMYYALSDAQVGSVIDAINEFFAE